MQLRGVGRKEPPAWSHPIPPVTVARDRQLAGAEVSVGPGQGEAALVTLPPSSPRTTGQVENRESWGLLDSMGGLAWLYLVMLLFI